MNRFEFFSTSTDDLRMFEFLTEYSLLNDLGCGVVVYLLRYLPGSVAILFLTKHTLGAVERLTLVPVSDYLAMYVGHGHTQNR